MLLGILSDTHGRSETARLAIALLLDRGAEFLIHAGDVGDGVIEILPAGKSAFVFGNTDYDVAEMRRLAAERNVQCLGHGGVLEFDGRKIAVCHGDSARLINGFLAAGVDYLLTGHTHVRHDHREGRTRLINPGALHRAVIKSVATLDLATDKLQFHNVNES
jgi:uncharacterized protein